MSGVRLGVLVDEKDNRLGTVFFGPSCFVVRYEDRMFYRTEKVVRLRHTHKVMATVFDETEPYERKRLDPI
jgi:hypothetical protein